MSGWDSVLLLQRAWVRSLVRERRSHMPCGAPPLPKKSKLFTFLSPLLGEEDGCPSCREVRRGAPSPKLRHPPPVPGLLPVHLLVMAAHGHGRVRTQQVPVLLPAAAHRPGDGLVRHWLRCYCLRELRGVGKRWRKTHHPIQPSGCTSETQIEWLRFRSEQKLVSCVSQL